MAYISSECTVEEYRKAIYSQDAKHKLYIKVGNTVLDNPDSFCEKLVWRNLLLDVNSKNFHLDNFVSKSVELILHDYLIQDLKSEIEIKIGTYINQQVGYVYVPLGLYKIQDTPTTDKNKTTYKLRDRAVNFDFKYNAKDLIDSSTHIDATGSKYVTKLEILDDICSKANMSYVGDRDFVGCDDAVAIYDNTINARIYVTYIFEQAGRIATIDREGNLTSILINNNLNVQKLLLELIESYTYSGKYKISKTIYESGNIKWEDGTDDYDILYINTANQYIANQQQLSRIQPLVNDFEIDSFKVSKIIGNPAIDSYDFITVPNNNIQLSTKNETTKIEWDGDLTLDVRTEAKASDEDKFSGKMTFNIDGWIFPEMNKCVKTITDIGTSIVPNEEALTRIYDEISIFRPLVHSVLRGDNWKKYNNPREIATAHPLITSIYRSQSFNNKEFFYIIDKGRAESMLLTPASNIIINGYNLKNAKVLAIPLSKHDIINGVDLISKTYENNLHPFPDSLEEKHNNISGYPLNITKHTDNQIIVNFNKPLTISGNFDLAVVNDIDYDMLSKRKGFVLKA